jgi:hypothetical protein
MSYLAKNIRTLALQLVFVAIIGVSAAGLYRQSLLLEWSAVVVTLVLLIADPLASPDRSDATPDVAACSIPQAKEKSTAPMTQLRAHLAPER